jgi:cytochrome b561
MSYLAKVLQPGEQVVHVGRLHWIMYLPAIIVVCIGLAMLAVPSTSDTRAIIYGISGVLMLIAALSSFRAWFKQFTTEIAVTVIISDLSAEAAVVTQIPAYPHTRQPYATYPQPFGALA